MSKKTWANRPDVDRLYYAVSVSGKLYIFWTWQERQLFMHHVVQSLLSFLYATNLNKDFRKLINTALKQNNFMSAEQTRAAVCKAIPDIYGRESNGQLAYEGDSGLNAYFSVYENRY